MAKIIAFLVFLCIQLSRGQEIAAVEKPKEDVLQQEILETYPLDIKLDEDDDIHKHIQPPQQKIFKNSQDSWKTNKTKLQEEYNKIRTAIEKWIKESKPKYGNYKWLRIVEIGIAAECANYYSYYYGTKFERHEKTIANITQLWADYAQVTTAVETWIRRNYPSMSRYKWLDIIEEESYESGIIPRCPTEVEDAYDYYDENDNGVGKYPPNGQNNWEDDLISEEKMWDEYTEVILSIEEWIMKAHPNLQLYKWLKVLEEGSILKGRIPKCSTKVESIYDYYSKDNQISRQKNQDQLTNDFSKISSEIEKWMQKAHPGKSNYFWLVSIEKGTKAKCPDYYNYGIETYNYDYYYDSANGMKLPSYKKPKTQFKRFTSV